MEVVFVPCSFNGDKLLHICFCLDFFNIYVLFKRQIITQMFFQNQVMFRWVLKAKKCIF